MLIKEKLSNEKIAKAVCEKIEENPKVISYKFLIGKNNEAFVFTEEFVEKNNISEFHQGFLYSVSSSNGRVSLTQVLKCEYGYIEFFKGNPYLDIELLHVLDESKMKSGLGTVMINYLEDLALKNKCYAVQGEFSPLRAEYKEDVQHFYERNGYSVTFGGMKDYFRKDKANLREVKTEVVGKINVLNTILSNNLLQKEIEK